MVSGKLASFIGKIENLAKRVFLEKANLSRKNMLIAACKPCKTWSGSTRTLITRLYHVETYSKGFLQLCKGWIGLLKNGGDEISMILIRKNFKNVFKMWNKAETKEKSNFDVQEVRLHNASFSFTWIFRDPFSILSDQRFEGLGKVGSEGSECLNMMVWRAFLYPWAWMRAGQDDGDVSIVRLIRWETWWVGIS